MSSHTAERGSIEDNFPRLVQVARWVFSLLLAGSFGAFFWLAMMQEGHAGRIFNRTWTDHDFPDGLGNAFGAQEAARTGLAASILCGVGLALVFALMEGRLPGSGWVKGLAFAPVILLLWGLVFCPLVDARQIIEVDGQYNYLPSGLFGSDSGGATLVTAAISSLVVGVVIARLLQLGRSPEWWRPGGSSREFVVDRGSGSLLEFPEQGSQQSGERTG